MHVNLFSAGHTRGEVYQALSEHQARDQRTLRFLDGVTALALLGAVTNYHGWATPLWLVAAVAGASAVRHFIDMSNRNFFMHRLDWEGGND